VCFCYAVGEVKGKSRLLREWSQGFHQAHPDTTLRFVSDRPADLGPALQTAPHPLVVVLDDAHRLPEVRQAIFSELARLPGIRLVLALRPGPLAQVRRELLVVGIDSTEIAEAEPVAGLGFEDMRALLGAILKPELAHWLDALARAAHDSPLVATLGAELLNRDEIAGSSLDNAPGDPGPGLRRPAGRRKKEPRDLREIRNG
jgi:hypothetical protein